MPPSNTTPHATTVQEVHLTFEATGEDASFAFFVMIAVFLGAMLFIYAYKLGLSFFEK